MEKSWREKNSDNKEERNKELTRGNKIEER